LNDKRARVNDIRLAAALVPRVLPLALLLLALGCAHTQNIRVVDAQTGKPLGDVWVRQGNSPTAGYTLKTDPSGMVQFQQSGKQYSLSRPGYEEARVELAGAVAHVSSAANPQGVEVKRYSDLVQIELRRQNAAAGVAGAERSVPQ
jgi:hypothetical protein